MELIVGGHGDRGHVQIATKFGIVRDAGRVRLDAHPDRVRGYCVQSLRRPGIEAAPQRHGVVAT